MTIRQIYDLSIKMGIDADPRSNQFIKKLLVKEKEKFQELKGDEKREYDKEKLTNPYSDSRMLVGDENKKIKRILVGIDITVGEVLLANKLSEKKPIDLIISHHPLGEAFAGLDDVMKMQADILAMHGVPINVAESLLEKRRGEVFRSIAPANHFQTVDAARLLGIPLICLHTPCDNMVKKFIKQKVKREKVDTVGELIKTLKSIPEYKEAIKRKTGPSLFAGSKERRCGKITIDLTGGTVGAKGVYEWLVKAGVGTIIGMHINEEHRKEAEKYHMNIVIAGHISSDSIGVNLFLDELEKKGIEIVPCSGFIKVRRR